MKNFVTRYGRIARVFHWSSVAIILMNVSLGLIAGSIGLEVTDPMLSQLRDLVLTGHKSLGLVFLLLVAARFSWKLYSPGPSLSAVTKLWEKASAIVVHWALYLIMFLLPLSGLFMTLSAGTDVEFFGLIDFPHINYFDTDIPIKERANFKIFRFVHRDVLPWAILIAVGLHLSGVAKHYVIDRDKSMLKRMWGR